MRRSSPCKATQRTGQQSHSTLHCILCALLCSALLSLSLTPAHICRQQQMLKITLTLQVTARSLCCHTRTHAHIDIHWQSHSNLHSLTLSEAGSLSLRAAWGGRQQLRQVLNFSCTENSYEQRCPTLTSLPRRRQQQQWQQQRSFVHLMTSLFLF